MEAITIYKNMQYSPKKDTYLCHIVETKRIVSESFCMILSQYIYLENSDKTYFKEQYVLPLAKNHDFFCQTAQMLQYTK